MFDTPPQTYSFSNKKQCKKTAVSSSTVSKEDKKNRSILPALDQPMTAKSLSDHRISLCDTIIKTDQAESDISSICSKGEYEEEFFLCTPTPSGSSQQPTTPTSCVRRIFFSDPTAIRSFSLRPRVVPMMISSTDASVYSILNLRA